MTDVATRAADWLMRTSDAVVGFEVIDESFAWLERADGSMVGLGAIDAPVLTGDMVADLTDDHPEAQIILNTGKPFRVDEHAYDAAEMNDSAICGWGDALRALNLEQPGAYELRDITFAFTYIRRHSNVSRVRRVGLGRFILERFRGDDIVVVLDTAYEPTTAAFVDALADGPYDIFYCTNPNGGGPSSSVYDAAKAAGTVVMRKPGEVMTALHRT